MKKYFAIAILFTNFSCLDAQLLNSENKMKATVVRLISYFQSSDTASIRKLFETEHNPAEPKEGAEILKDCNYFKKLINKYGLPNTGSLRIAKGTMQENVVYTTIMQKDDSTLNLKRCQLGVLFYPDQFLKNPDKILTYQLVKVSLTNPEGKILLPPLQKHNR